MHINGHRVAKTRVEIKGSDLVLTFYGTSPRGTPLMLGAVDSTRSTLPIDIKAAPEKLARNKGVSLT